MMQWTRKSLKTCGFRGFIPVSHLRTTLASVPNAPGIYAVLYELKTRPRFRPTNNAGRIKGRDPTIEVTRLRSKWVKTPITGSPGR